MKNQLRSACLFLSGSLLFACNTKTSTQEEVATDKTETNTIGSIEIKDDQLKSIVNVNAQIEVLSSGFLWSEGPVWVPELKTLLFSDVPKNTVYSWSEKDSIQVYLMPSGYTGKKEGREGSNGLIINNEGQLVLCQHGDRQLSKMDAPLNAPKTNYLAISDSFDGKLFNSPNDVVQSKNGTYFFTDPPYGLESDDIKELDYQGVFKFSNNTISLLIDSLSKPNGIALSIDERVLYIAQSDPNAARYYAYELDENQNIVSGKILLDVTDLLSDDNKGLPDGLKIDDSGNLFATGPGGVLIISPEGKHLGTIRTENATANCAFNEDKSVLYMTAHSHLMRVSIR